VQVDLSTLKKQSVPAVGGVEFALLIVVKPVQLENASDPIEVTLLGLVILVKPVQPKNA
jgi:hypothetical protein